MWPCFEIYNLSHLGKEDLAGDSGWVWGVGGQGTTIPVWKAWVRDRFPGGESIGRRRPWKGRKQGPAAAPSLTQSVNKQ